MNLDISLVPYGMLTDTLPTMSAYLRKSEMWTKGRSSIDDIVGFLYSGRMQLWAIYEPESNTVYGYIISEIKQYPSSRALVFQHIASEKHIIELVQDKFHELMDRYARDAGCSVIEAFGRPGWGKYLEKYDYTVQTVVYERYLGEKS